MAEKTMPASDYARLAGYKNKRNVMPIAGRTPPVELTACEGADEAHVVLNQQAVNFIAKRLQISPEEAQEKLGLAASEPTEPVNATTHAEVTPLAPQKKGRPISVRNPQGPEEVVPGYQLPARLLIVAQEGEEVLGNRRLVPLSALERLFAAPGHELRPLLERLVEFGTVGNERVFYASSVEKVRASGWRLPRTAA